MLLNGLYPRVACDAGFTVNSGEDDDTDEVVVVWFLAIEREWVVLLELERFFRFGFRKCPTII